MFEYQRIEEKKDEKKEKEYKQGIIKKKYKSQQLNQ